MKRAAYTHTKTLLLASALGVRRSTAIGTLDLLWNLTATEAPRGDVGRLSDRAIALACDWDREPAELIAALVECRLLDEHPEYRLLVHDWPEHAEDTVHVQLARQRQVFADGAEPKKNRLSQAERAALAMQPAPSQTPRPRSAKPKQDPEPAEGEPCAHRSAQKRTEAHCLSLSLSHASMPTPTPPAPTDADAPPGKRADERASSEQSTPEPPNPRTPEPAADVRRSVLGGEELPEHEDASLLTAADLGTLLYQGLYDRPPKAEEEVRPLYRYLAACTEAGDPITVRQLRLSCDRARKWWREEKQFRGPIVGFGCLEHVLTEMQTRKAERRARETATC